MFFQSERPVMLAMNLLLSLENLQLERQYTIQKHNWKMGE